VWKFSKVRRKKEKSIMYARVTTIPGNHVDQVIEYLGSANDEGLEDMKGVYVLVDEKKEKMMTITLWESKEKVETTLSGGQRNIQRSRKNYRNAC
jgi:hypothetical protein